MRDAARLLRLLSNTERPVQLIIAGKAHPADEPGQALIRQWMQFIRGTEARNHVIFLADYDMAVAEQLVQGVDVWINTPRRPWEACGTSGMKVLVNGGINLSQLDGWWAEAYRPEVGWAIGDAPDPWRRWASGTTATPAALYDLLEREVVPQFYARDAAGIPTAWIARMRESMASLTPQFSSSRAVRDYTQRYYLPAALEWLRRSADSGQGKGEAWQQMLQWRERLDGAWGQLRFENLMTPRRPADSNSTCSVQLAGLAAADVAVQLYANGIDGAGPQVYDMTLQSRRAPTPARAVPCIGPPSRRIGPRATTLRGPCRAWPAPPCHWKRTIFCGSDRPARRRSLNFQRSDHYGDRNLHALRRAAQTQ